MKTLPTFISKDLLARIMWKPVYKAFWEFERCPFLNRSRLPLPAPTPKVNIQTTITFRPHAVFHLLYNLNRSLLRFLITFRKGKDILSQKFNNDFRDRSVVILAFRPSLIGRGGLVSQRKIGNQWHMWLIALGLGSDVSRMLCYDGRRPQVDDPHAHQDRQEINFRMENFHRHRISRNWSKRINGFLSAFSRLWEGKSQCAKPCGISQWKVFLRTFVFYSRNQCFASVTYIFRRRSSEAIRSDSIIIIVWQMTISTLFFCCSSAVPRQHFITCHSWFHWKAFQNQLISKSHVFVVCQIIWNNNARHNQKSRWILQSALRSHGLNIPGNFRGLPLISSWLGRVLAKRQNHFWPLRVVFDECVLCLWFESKSRR